MTNVKDEDAALRGIARAQSNAAVKLIRLRHQTMELAKVLENKKGVETEEESILRQVLAEELAVTLRENDYLTQKIAALIRSPRSTFDPFKTGYTGE